MQQSLLDRLINQAFSGIKYESAPDARGFVLIIREAALLHLCKTALTCLPYQRLGHVQQYKQRLIIQTS